MTECDALERTPEQIRQDENILAMIIAGAIIAEREVLPHFDRRTEVLHGHCYGDDPDGPCCAVGAGLLYVGVKIESDHAPLVDFANMYGVSAEYARWVSHGFEGVSEPAWKMTQTQQRGFAVGRAAYDALVAL